MKLTSHLEYTYETNKVTPGAGRANRLRGFRDPVMSFTCGERAI